MAAGGGGLGVAITLPPAWCPRSLHSGLLHLGAVRLLSAMPVPVTWLPNAGCCLQAGESRSQRGMHGKRWAAAAAVAPEQEQALGEAEGMAAAPAAREGLREGSTIEDDPQPPVKL